MEISQQHYHAVQFCKDAQSLSATVARFLAEGLNAGQPALVVATSLHVYSVSAELTRLGLDPQQLRATGELQVLDARKVLNSFMVGGRPDPLMFKSNVGDAIERLCVGRTPARSVCTAKRSTCSGRKATPRVLSVSRADIEGVCRQHSHVVQPA